MRDNVAHDLSRSAYDFLNTVWPQVAPYCRGGTFYPTESVQDRGFISHLDLYSGIDGFQFIENLGVMRGIAARVQYTRAYDTFTIRYARTTGARTEFAKRIEAILNEEDGYLYPHLTIHAYLSEHRGEFLQAGITRTKDLYLYTKEHFRESNTKKDSVYLDTCGEDKNKFLVVKWNPYKTRGNNLAVVKERDIVARAAKPNVGLIAGLIDKSFIKAEQTDLWSTSA